MVVLVIVEIFGGSVDLLITCRVRSTSKESCSKTKHFSEFIGEFEDSLIGCLFGPVAAETDRGVDILGMAVMEKIDNDMVSIGV